MIWDIETTSDDNTSPLVSHLTAEIDACGGIALSPTQILNVAEAINSFLGDRQDSALESRYLVLLASRALKSLGETRSARRLFLYGSGLMRPSEWAVTAGKEMWVLDLQQMTFKRDAFIELVFFNSLRVVLEATADIWDATQGQGVLGLQNICVVAGQLLATGSKSAAAQVTNEITDMCNRTFDHLANRREWTHKPEILPLDLV